MSKRIVCGAIVLGLSCLIGCDQRPADPPAPQVAAGKPYVEKPFAPAPDPSVPSADSVLSPPTTPTANDAASTRPNANLTRTEESSAMPKSGQTNNYSSTALDAGKAASAP